MRRILAITLLIAFGSPLVAPMFAATADREASLPACCRRHGTHHCSTMVSPFGATSSPAFQAPRCLSYPIASTQLRLATASLIGSPRVARETTRDRAMPLASLRHDQALASSANLKRGPPTPLA